MGFDGAYEQGVADGDILTNHLHEVVNKTWNFAGRLTEPQHHEQNALVGLASESGEALDIGKKTWFHTPGTDRRAALRSEFGDICYYLIKAIEVHGFTLEEVLEDNRKKLASRHPELGEVTERFGKGAIR